MFCGYREKFSRIPDVGIAVRKIALTADILPVEENPDRIAIDRKEHQDTILPAF